MYKDDMQEWHAPLAELLIKEADDKATIEDIETLDAATGRLLLSVTAEIGNRRGTIPV
jgi:hypothetical protein